MGKGREFSGGSDSEPVKKAAPDQKAIIRGICDAMTQRTSNLETFVYVRMIVEVFVHVCESESQVIQHIHESDKVDYYYKETLVWGDCYFQRIKKAALNKFEQERTGLPEDDYKKISARIVKLFELQSGEEHFRKFVTFAKVAQEFQYERRVATEIAKKKKNATDNQNTTQKKTSFYLVVSVMVNLEGNLYTAEVNDAQRENRAAYFQGHSAQWIKTFRDDMPNQKMFYELRKGNERPFPRHCLTKREYEEHEDHSLLSLKSCAEWAAVVRMMNKTQRSEEDVLRNSTFCTIGFRQTTKKNGTVEVELGLRGPCKSCELFINEENSIHEDQRLEPILEALKKATQILGFDRPAFSTSVYDVLAITIAVCLFLFAYSQIDNSFMNINTSPLSNDDIHNGSLINELLLRCVNFRVFPKMCFQLNFS